MSKETTTVVLGLFVAVLPFLGFPQAWRNIFFLIAGVGIMILGFLLRADHLHRSSTASTAQSRRSPTRKSTPAFSDVAASTSAPAATPDAVPTDDVHN